MPNLKTASNRANQKYNSNKPNAAAVASLGTLKSAFDEEAILTSIEEAIGNFIERVINNIDKAVGKTGEPLMNTGNITNIQAIKSETGWKIVAPPYFDYQSKGVSGTKKAVPNSPYRFSGSKKTVNIDSVKEWIQQRGIIFEGMTQDQTAFLIAKSIYEKGITAKNLWEDEVELLKKEINIQIAEQIKNSFTLSTSRKNIKLS